MRPPLMANRHAKHSRYITHKPPHYSSRYRCLKGERDDSP